MNAKKGAFRALGVLVAVTSLIILAVGSNAIAQIGPAPQSDRMVILAPGGAPVLFDNLIPEPAPPGLEPTLTFAGPPVPVPPPIPLPVAIGLPGAGVVVLTEPVGTPPDPGEVPIVTVIPGTNQQVVVSDIVISTLGNNQGVAPFITLVSDGGPDLAQLVPLLPLGTVFLPETGLLQDLTPFLVPPGNPFGPITALVQSDIPEPSSVVLAALGFAGLLAWGWRRRGALNKV
jgi:hypothetical protein